MLAEERGEAHTSPSIMDSIVHFSLGQSCLGLLLCLLSFHLIRVGTAVL